MKARLSCTLYKRKVKRINTRFTDAAYCNISVIRYLIRQSN